MTAQAGRLRAFLRRVCHPRTIERLIDPILGDIAFEHREVQRRGERWRARWILVLGYLGLCRAMALHRAGAWRRQLKLDEVAVRTIAASLTAFVVLTLVLILPPLIVAIPRMHHMSVGFLVLLVPQALPLAVPLAVSIGLGWGWPRDRDAARPWRGGMALGVAGGLIAAANMQWLVPAANQGFRMAVAAELRVDNVHVPRGINERSLTEILAIMRASRPDRWTPREDDWIAIQLRELTATEPELTSETLLRTLHLRLALCAATGTIALLAIAVARLIPRRKEARAAFAATVLLYVGSWFVVPAAESPLTAVAGAWCPNVLAVILAAGIWSVSVVRRRPSSG